MRYDASTCRITGSGWLPRATGIVAAACLGLSAVGYFADSRQFLHSWLVAFFFWTSLALGGLFFTMLHHIVAARWSVVLRRLAEDITAVLPFMAIVFIPLLFGLHDLYHWTDRMTVEHDHLLSEKAPYLNTPFFVIRLAGYFVIWSALSRLLFKTSMQQDQGHHAALTTRFRRISAPGIILFAVTLTFASFDWLMSLDAHWYSTIFGVYVFAGSMVGLLALLTVLVLSLQRAGALSEAITVEHLHDLGKLTFAFVVFWGYMAFSQYFLIWYGNIPEETVWFLHRWEGSWKTVSLLIVFGHFAVPFFLLFPRAPKRNRTVLLAAGLWLLMMHAVDVYWLVMPSLHEHGVEPSWIDVVTFFGAGGVFLSLLWRYLKHSPLLPVNDPYLQSSKQFVNY